MAGRSDAEILLRSLIAASFILITMAFSLPFFEAGLGLAGFCFLMWVTIPWAFAQRLDELTKDLEDNKRKERLAWLRVAEDSFLASGIFFSITVISESGLTRSVPPTIASTTEVIAFIGFALAIMQTFLIVDYVSFPETERTDLWASTAYIGGLMAFMTLWGFNAILLWHLIKTPPPFTQYGTLMLLVLFLGATVTPVTILQVYRRRADVSIVLVLGLVGPLLLYLIFASQGLPLTA